MMIWYSDTYNIFVFGKDKKGFDKIHGSVPRRTIFRETLSNNLSTYLLSLNPVF